MHKSQTYLFWSRNVLIGFGAFWLSSQLAVLFAWLFGQVASGNTYYDGVGAAVAMGVTFSMGRAVSAGLGAAIVALAGLGSKPYRWSLVVALLYIVAARPNYHWVRPPTGWDRLMQVTDSLWPAVLCVIVAAVIGWLQRSRPAGNIQT